MGVWKIWNTNGGINMGTDSYYINENNEFVIEDYNQQKPFKSSEEQAKKTRNPII